MQRRWSAAISCLITATLSAAGFGQPPPAPPDVAADIASDTPIGSGPYRAVMEMAAGLPTHTLYPPANMVAAGKLPIIAWGNGACLNAGNSFRWFLSDIASYGYLIIALGPIPRALKPFAPGG